MKEREGTGAGKEVVMISDIVRVVCQEFGVTEKQVRSHCRNREVVEARHAVWLTATYAGYQPTVIAYEINHGHAVIYNSIRRSIELCVTDRGYKLKIFHIINMIRDEKVKKNNKRYGKEGYNSNAVFACALDAIV